MYVRGTISSPFEFIAALLSAGVKLNLSFIPLHTTQSVYSYEEVNENWIQMFVYRTFWI